MNRKTIVVTELAYRNGTELRTIPTDTVVLSSEDLTVLALRGTL